MSALGEALAALKLVLDGHTEGWYVFGAQAVSVRGAPRATMDLDVTVAVDSHGLPALVDALHAASFSDRHPDSARELLDRARVLALRHDPTAFEVDVVIAGSGLETIALSRASVARVAGVDVPVAHATDLVVMKVLAGRGKDIDDVRALLAGGQVDAEEARTLLRELEEALGRSDLVPVLDRMIYTIEAG